MVWRAIGPSAGRRRNVGLFSSLVSCFTCFAHPYDNLGEEEEDDMMMELARAKKNNMTSLSLIEEQELGREEEDHFESSQLQFEGEGSGTTMAIVEEKKRKGKERMKGDTSL